MKIREYIVSRRKEVQKLISDLRLELAELKLAEAALNTGTTSQRLSDETESRGKLTIKDKILEVLGGRVQGADANEIIALIKFEFGEDIQRPSLSPQLSRLKQDGYLTVNNGIWKLSEFDSPVAETTGPPKKYGDGIVQAPDFPIASPEGASPSISSPNISNFLKSLDDDIPF